MTDRVSRCWFCRPIRPAARVHHDYGDHVSILKFIERNWNLQPLTNRSRDNLPNPKTAKNNPYVPTNSPALDDLFDAFDFDHAVTQPYTSEHHEGHGVSCDLTVLRGADRALTARSALLFSPST